MEVSKGCPHRAAATNARRSQAVQTTHDGDTTRQQLHSACSLKHHCGIPTTKKSSSVPAALSLQTRLRTNPCTNALLTSIMQSRPILRLLTSRAHLFGVPNRQRTAASHGAHWRLCFCLRFSYLLRQQCSTMSATMVRLRRPLQMHWHWRHFHLWVL